ncbi:MAG: hypothetical protein FWE32_11980 [Oscillospiraceae bacterium]|nr:hypothetical protein [Oscillospiraceae bacterium]
MAREKKMAQPRGGLDIAFYILYAGLAGTLYGLFAFFVIYRGLAGGVMLNAYFWNIAFIILFLLFDKIANDILLSKEWVITRENYLVAMIIHSASLISFKTTLYLFYTFVLIISRVSLLAPDLVSEEMRGFILPIEYCLILLVVFDKFIEYLLKDDVRVRKITAKFEKFATLVAKKASKSEAPR